MTSTLLQNVTEFESVDLLNDSVISVNDSQESQSEISVESSKSQTSQSSITSMLVVAVCFHLVHLDNY